MTDRSVTVFYSWQDDLPANTNKNAIRKSLRDALTIVEDKIEGVKMLLDEATVRKSGAVNIPQTILDKVRVADAFVADVTPTATAEGGERGPNPNVVFELGYAVAHLGWERIILLFNTAFGAFPNDLPFDFDRHRASPFKVTNGSKIDRKSLTDLLAMAVKEIVEADPKRPAEEGLSSAQRRRKRDIENLRWAGSWLHIPTLDRHIEEMPHKLWQKAVLFYDAFNGVMTSSLFHLYDAELDRAIRRLYFAWRETVSHDDCYHEGRSGDVYFFTNPGDMPLRGKKADAWKRIDKARREMGEALDQLLTIIRTNYDEVDPDELSAQAHKRYLDMERDWEEDVTQG